MGDYCTRCGTKLSFMQRMSGTALWPGCREKRQALHQEALAQYLALLRSIWNGTVTEAYFLLSQVPCEDYWRLAGP